MNPYSDIATLEKKHLTSAQEALHKAFVQVAKNTPYGRISITDLCKKANVARTTFYFSYPNSDVLLEEVEDGLIVDLLKVTERTDQEDEFDYISNVMAFVDASREELYLLLVDQPDIRFIEKSLLLHMTDG